ncbi:DUF4194 domain-containing protein [Rhizobacter fulvus]
MNSSADDEMFVAEVPVAPLPAGYDASRSSLFTGDTGALPLDTRRVLVQLMLGPSMDSTRQTQLWPTLLRDEAIIRSRLHDLFLELVVDRDQQVAFTRQAPAGDVPFPVLLRKLTLNFLETAAVLYLRLQLTQADAQVERSVLSGQDLRDHLMVYEKADNVDRSGFAARVRKAIEKLTASHILTPLGAGTDRFEISPTLKLLFSADEVQSLTRLYTEAAQRTSRGYVDDDTTRRFWNSAGSSEQDPDEGDDQ